MIELTDDQQKAYDFIAECYNNKSNYAVLSGQAGTGKTFLTNKIESEIFKGKTAGITISHKAKNVLKKAVDSKNVQVMTYAKSLGKYGEYNEETGETDFRKIGEPQLHHDNYFVDECSMFDQEMIDEFEEEVDNVAFMSKPFILYVGDHHQLPPIRSKDSNGLDFSPLFKMKNVITMNEIVRQELDNPIRKLTKSTANAIDNNIDIRTLLKTFKSDFDKELQKGIYIYQEHQKVIDDYVNLFRKDVEFGNSNKMVIVAYRRKIVRQINKDIRKLLGFENQFEKGDIIITTSTYTNELTNTFVTNGEEFWVETVTPDIIDSLPVYILEAIRIEDDETKKVILPVLSYRAYPEYKRRKDELRQNIIDSPFKKKGYYKILIRKYIDQFCSVEYGHATTAYKVQGTTVDTVFVNISDILSVSPLNNLQKLQSVYVGITRAKNRLIIY